MIELIITSSALIIAVIVIRFLFRGKISRRLQYMLWGLVLLRLLLPVSVFDSPLSVMNALPDSSLNEIPVYSIAASDQPTAETPGVTINDTGTVSDTASSGDMASSGNKTPTGQSTDKPEAQRILFLIWLTGSMAVGLWFIRTNIVFYNRLRQSRQKYHTDACQLSVYISDTIASPCLFGVIRPAVYLTPQAVENSETRIHVLTHELCHYRHGDHLWSALRGLCLAIYWWHPLVWAAAILSRNDSELACDESVIRKIGEHNRLAYGYTLVDMIAVRKAPSGLVCAATTMISGKRGVKERLNMIVKNPRTVLPMMAAVILIITVCAACTFTGAMPGNDQTTGNEESPYYAQQLYDLKNPYIGDASADSALLNALNIRAALGDYTMELETAAEPYILRLNFTDEVTGATMFNNAMDAYAMLLLALIDNASEIQWRYHYTDPSTGGSGVFTGSLTAADATATLNGADIKSYGQSAVKVQELLDWLDTQNADSVKYGLMKLVKGDALYARSLLTVAGAQVAENAVMNFMLKSAAWPGVDIGSLKECYMIRASYPDGTITDYYAFLKDGEAVMQRGEDGYYSRLDDNLYEELVNLAESSLSTVGGADGPYSVIVNTDRSDLEACISEAIISHNAGQYHSGDFAAEAHTVLKTVEHGKTTTVYLMALYLEFGYAGGGFSQNGGSHGPAALTFNKNDAGEYALEEYWIPQDGAGYGPSIKEKFPADIYDDAIDTQKYILGHTQACYAQAVAYGKVDTDTIIEKLLQTIMSSPSLSSNAQDYIDAHAIEYRELLYYGDYTLRYVYGEFLKGGQTGLKGHIMLAAMRDLLGSEDMGLEASTTQEWFDQWKDHAISLRDKNSLDFMKENYPKAYLLLIILEEAND